MEGIDMIKRPMEIEPLDEWAKENGMDIVFSI